MGDESGVSPACGNDDLWSLCARVCDGTLDDDGMARLEGLLTTDAADRICDSHKGAAMGSEQGTLPVCRDDQLWSLCSRMCDGTLDGEGQARLEGLLEADAASRLFYASYLRMHGQLLRVFRPMVSVSVGDPAIEGGLPNLHET